MSKSSSLGADDDFGDLAGEPGETAVASLTSCPLVSTSMALTTPLMPVAHATPTAGGVCCCRFSGDVPRPQVDRCSGGAPLFRFCCTAASLLLLLPPLINVVGLPPANRAVPLLLLLASSSLACSGIQNAIGLYAEKSKQSGGFRLSTKNLIIQFHLFLLQCVIVAHATRRSP